MGKYKDLSGQEFGWLTVISLYDAGESKHGKLWLCRCRCGKEVIVASRDLCRGHKQSCGCKPPLRLSPETLIGQKCGALTVIAKGSTNHSVICLCECGNTIEMKCNIWNHKEQKSCGCQRPVIDGRSKSRLYKVYMEMLRRCTDPKNPDYDSYGGRGIKVCEEWATSFDAFRSWALANGGSESAKGVDNSLDRIDVNGNYEPANCRWISLSEQQYNKRTTIKLEKDGEVHTLKEWAQILHLPYITLYSRIYCYHMPIELSLTPGKISATQKALYK